MKGVYVAVMALFLFGVGLSLYLLLSPEDYALMLLKGERYSDAEEYYKSKYLNGNRSASILVPLKTLEVAKGENDEAIILMEKYVEEHPEDISARNLLGTLYLNSQKRETYLSNLEEIQTLDPSKSVLEELHEWYAARGDKVKEEALLEELISRGYGKAVHYDALAYLLASRQNYAEAFGIMRSRENLFPKEASYKATRFEIALLLEMGRLVDERRTYDEKIITLARQFLAKAEDPLDAVDLLGVLQSQKRQDLSFRLLPSMHYLAMQSLELQTEIIELEWSYGDKEKAYTELMTVYRTHILNNRLSELLARMSIEKGYYLILGDLLDHYDPAHLSEMTLLDLAVIALKSKDPALAREAEVKLGTKYLSAHPAIQVALLLAQGDPQGEEKLREFVKTDKPTGYEALALMRLASEGGHKKLALEMGKNLFPFGQMSSEELYKWALIYIEMEENKEGLRILEGHAQEIMREREGQALALLHLSVNNTKPAEEWLTKHPGPDPEFLIFLYREAEKVKAYPFALMVATRLYQRAPSPITQYYYAIALLNQGDPEKALPLLKTLAEGVGPQESKYGYLRALAASGESHHATFLTYLDQLLESDLAEYQRRDIGYMLLENGQELATAEKIFSQLARKKKPLKSDIDSFLYIVGPKPSSETIQWIEQQAQEAPDTDKLRWAQALINISKLQEALNTLESLPTEKWTREEYRLALGTRFQLHDEKGVKALLCRALDYLTNPKEIEQAIVIARGVGALKIQRVLFTHLSTQDPENPLYWRGLGRVCYELSDFTCALCAFNRYFSFDPSDPELYAAYFFYGEILTLRNDPLLAEGFYWMAFDAIAAAEERNPAMNEMEATVYARLRNKWAGVRLMNDLYCKEPNPDLRAAMANLFMEMGHLGAAHKILYARVDGGVVKQETVLIRWDKPVEATLKMVDGDALITASIPISHADLQKASEKLPPQIEKLQAGYNTLVIGTGKPTTYVLKTEKEAEGDGYMMQIDMTISPTPFPPSLAIGLAKANLAIRQRQYSDACALLADLRRRYPENSDVMSLIAAVEQSVGKWQCALNWMAQAHQVAPCNENVWVAYREIFFPHSSFIGFERETLLTHQTSAEHFYRLQGDWLISRNLFRCIYLNAQAEQVSAHISQVFTPQGFVEGFLGHRSRGHIKARNDNLEGREFEWTVYAGDSLIGTGARWLTRFDQGSLFAYFDWNRPYWWILETLVNHGNENRAGFGGRYVCNAQLDGLLDIGVRQYGIKGDPYATSSAKIEGNILFLLTLKNPIIALNYILDAEYIFAEKERVNPFGDPFQPVPLDSRENHTLRLVVRTIWHKWWAWGGFLGETFNRLGTHNFTIGVNFHYYSPCGFEFDFSMERYPSTTTLGAQAEDIKGAVKWRF